MDKKVARIIFIGMAIGALFGLMVELVTGNALLSAAFGAVGGGFVGWFIAIAVQQYRKEQSK